MAGPRVLTGGGGSGCRSRPVGTPYSSRTRRVLSRCRTIPWMQGLRGTTAKRGTVFLRNHRGVVEIRAIMNVIAYGSGMPLQRDGLYDKKAGVENQTLSPGLSCSLEPGSSIELC